MSAYTSQLRAFFVGGGAATGLGENESDPVPTHGSITLQISVASSKGAVVVMAPLVECRIRPPARARARQHLLGSTRWSETAGLPIAYAARIPSDACASAQPTRRDDGRPCGWIGGTLVRSRATWPVFLS
jgi:hypothetical protein